MGTKAFHNLAGLLTGAMGEVIQSAQNADVFKPFITQHG